ncbi:MAG TPA: hypothetical protein PK530_23710, partial [Anaerolineales bacterium]|nr:hypothetical protein [Anaerolineales bacterium]
MNLKRLFLVLAVVMVSLAFVAVTLAAADFSQPSNISSQISTESLNHRISFPAEKAQFTPLFSSWSGINRTPLARAPFDVGAWDGNGVRYPMIVQDGGTYKMWFTGIELNGPGRIGYATSPDGITWTKSPSNPVLDVGAPGEWDENGLEAPFVIQESPTSYKMWYSGFGGCAIGYATSSDGINWTKYAGNPVLTPGPNPWNNDCAIHPYLLYEGGVYKMWL